MANQSGSGKNDDTFIMPGVGGGKGTQSAPTNVAPQGRTGSPPTGQPSRFVDPFETVLMPTARRQGSTPGSEAGAPMSDTMVVRPDQAGTAGAQSSAINPIVGLLVITAGPGKGSSRPLYYGNNSIGRDHSQRTVVSRDPQSEHTARTHSGIQQDTTTTGYTRLRAWKLALRHWFAAA